MDDVNLEDHTPSAVEEFTLEVEGLFDDNARPHMVVGSVSALTALQEAFGNGLVISQEMVSGSAAFDASCIYLQDIAAMPDLRQESILNQLRDDATRGIAKLDHIAEDGNPPFQSHHFTIDGIPRLLRCFAKFHVQHYFGKFNYQLGVLTLLPDGSLTAQVFASTLQKIVTHTVWIFRSITTTTIDGKGYSESFAAFKLPQDITPPGVQYTARNQLRAAKRAVVTDDPDLQPAQSQAQQSRVAERQSPKSRGCSAAAWQNKWLIEERNVDATNFFDGRLHPDDIQGELVLELVPHVSTVDFQARINDLYEKIEGSKRLSNFATLRFRNALIAKCEREGLDRETEWMKVQNERRKNRVKPDTGNAPALHLGMNKGNTYAKRNAKAADQAKGTGEDMGALPGEGEANEMEA